MKKAILMFGIMLMTVCAAFFALGMADLDDEADECDMGGECNWVFRQGTPATCEEDGEGDTYYCSKCYSYKDGAPKQIVRLGHDIIETEAVAPTCESVGYTAGTRCSRCEKMTEGREEIPALGHRAVTIAGKAPTCTEKGETAREICEVCNTVLKEGEEIPAKGHNYKNWEEEREATCTQEGLLFSYCEDCRQRAEQSVAPIGHDEKRIPAENPTCEEEGYREYFVCSRCDEELTTKESILALGHEYGAGIFILEATCEGAGLLRKECTRCGHRAEEPVPPTGHHAAAREGRAPTCTADGCLAYEECAVCGKELTKKTPVSALGHEFTEGELIKEATCEGVGILKRICNRCGESIEEEVSATGHFPVTKAGKEATCTEQGYTVSVVCGVCDTVIKNAEEIAPIEHRYENGQCAVCGKKESRPAPSKPQACTHEYGEWETVEPTCTEDGFQTRTCLLCGHTEETLLAAHGHDYGDFLEVQAPTCTKAGILERVCKYDQTHVERRELSALGHVESVTEGKEATCEEEGYTEERVCKVCGEIISKKATIASLGHDWEEEITKQPTYRESGEKSKTCTICGKVETETLQELGGKGKEFLAAIDALRAAKRSDWEAMAKRAKELYGEVEFPDLVAEECAYLQSVLSQIEAPENQQQQLPSNGTNQGETSAEPDKIVLIISLSVAGGVVLLLGIIGGILMKCKHKRIV